MNQISLSENVLPGGLFLYAAEKYRTKNTGMTHIFIGHSVARI